MVSTSLPYSTSLLEQDRELTYFSGSGSRHSQRHHLQIHPPSGLWPGPLTCQHRFQTEHVRSPWTHPRLASRIRNLPTQQIHPPYRAHPRNGLHTLLPREQRGKVYPRHQKHLPTSTTTWFPIWHHSQCHAQRLRLRTDRFKCSLQSYVTPDTPHPLHQTSLRATSSLPSCMRTKGQGSQRSPNQSSH
jgi:hypothetical protein